MTYRAGSGGVHPKLIESQRRETWVKNRALIAIERLRLIDKDNPSVADIWNEVGAAFGALERDIGSHTTFWIDVAARDVTMALAWRFTKLSLAEIVKQCGRHYRFIAIRACQKYDRMLDELFKQFGITLQPRSFDEPAEPARRELPRRREQPRQCQQYRLSPRQRAMRALGMTEDDLRALRQLQAWSIEDAYSVSEDVMPNLSPISAAGKLHRLKNNGWAETEVELNTTWWRITPAGRNALAMIIETAPRVAMRAVA